MRLRSRFPAAASLLVLGTTLAGQVPQFRPLPRLPLPSTSADAPFKLAVADFNRDGLPDVVFANMGSAMPGLQERLFLADGRGGYSDVTTTNLPAALNWTGALAVGDFDKDGDLDVFFGNTSTQIHCLYFNDGTAKFTDVSATNLPSAGMLGKTCYACAAVDIDFDGDLDLIVRDLILLNNGAGVFTDVTATNAPGALAFSPWGMAVGDVTGDAFPDIIFGGTNTQPVLWVNKYNGTFALGTTSFPAMSVKVQGSIGIGDVDGDGDRDLLFPYFQGQPLLWLNNGTGTFTDATATNLPVAAYHTYNLALGDLDGDGSLDCVFANIQGGSSAAQSNVWLNNGRGVFTDATATRFPVVAHKSVSLAIADLDLDGDNDIVFGNWFEAGEVWFNHHGQTYSDNAPAIGMPYQLDVYAKPGYMTLPHSTVAFVGAQGYLPRVLVPPFGYLGVDLSVVLVFPGNAILAPGGKATTTVTIPNNVALRGQALHWQSTILDPVVGLRLANPFVEIVQ